jgi:ABC-2 type transport system permease protein
MPYDMAAGVLMLTGIIVSLFYCLDALHSERRDRSILFWKSLPVSDVTTVLAKASIPLIVVPLLTFAITIAMQWTMLLVSSAVLLLSGQSVATLWRSLPLASMWLLLLYHLITAHAIWPFPIYCWLLLVSGWARRATFLWAALPLVAIAGVEGIVFRTGYFATLIGRRFIGDAPAMHMTPDSMGLDPLTTHVTVGRFLTSPGLWIGLALAAIFLAAAVRLRRYQGPI